MRMFSCIFLLGALLLHVEAQSESKAEANGVNEKLRIYQPLPIKQIDGMNDQSGSFNSEAESNAAIQSTLPYWSGFGGSYLPSAYNSPYWAGPYGLGDSWGGVPYGLPWSNVPWYAGLPAADVKKDVNRANYFPYAFGGGNSIPWQQNFGINLASDADGISTQQQPIADSNSIGNPVPAESVDLASLDINAAKVKNEASPQAESPMAQYLPGSW